MHCMLRLDVSTTSADLFKFATMLRGLQPPCVDQTTDVQTQIFLESPITEVAIREATEALLRSTLAFCCLLLLSVAFCYILLLWHLHNCTMAPS